MSSLLCFLWGLGVGMVGHRRLHILLLLLIAIGGSLVIEFICKELGVQ